MGLALWAAMLAALVAVVAGLRMGRGARAADGSGLASAGRLPTMWTLKNTAAEKRRENDSSCLFLKHLNMALELDGVQYAIYLGLLNYKTALYFSPGQ